MKRFDIESYGGSDINGEDFHGYRPVECIDGDYILFTDHEAELKNLKDDCDEMLTIAYMCGAADGKSDKEAAIKKAVEDEREACAKLADEIESCPSNSNDDIATAHHVAKLIRQRSAQN